ncbi:MAG: response regulator [Candidatus Heimdallarchaeota archaeon]|nr:response regulator [Candidatus Heimdallarchaeota archaeon]
MTLEEKIIIIDSDTSMFNDFKKPLSDKGFEVLHAIDAKTALNLLTKNKPLIALVELNIASNNEVEFLQNIQEISPQTNSIIITRELSAKLSKAILETGDACFYIKRPFNFNDLYTKISKILNKNRKMIESQKSLQDLFESYNQLEFLISILINELESSTNLLEKISKEINISDLNENQKFTFENINRLFHNNKKLLERLNNLRLVEEIKPAKLSSVNLNQIIDKVFLQIKEEYNQFTSNFKKNVQSKNMCVKGFIEEIKILVNEAFYLVSLPNTNFCDCLVINLRRSDNLLDKNNKKIPTIELELISILKKTKNNSNDDIIEPLSQQYGFGYFLLKELVEGFNGEILLVDNKIGKKIETKLTILLPSS